MLKHRLGAAGGCPTARRGNGSRGSKPQRSPQDPSHTDQFSFMDSILHMNLMSYRQKPSPLFPLPQFREDSGELWERGIRRNSNEESNPMKSLEAEPSKEQPGSTASFSFAPMDLPSWEMCKLRLSRVSHSCHCHSWVPGTGSEAGPRHSPRAAETSAGTTPTEQCQHHHYEEEP